MIVACPSCQTRFKLDPAKLGPSGRNVRCARCGHRWHQLPEGVEPVEAAPAQPAGLAETPPTAPLAEAPPGVPSGVPSGPPSGALSGAAQPTEALPEQPPPEEAEPHPPSPPETPAEMAESLAAIAEQVAGARGDGYTVTEGAPAGLQNPIQRLARRMPGSGPGPITVPPRMRPMRPAKRSSHLGLILAAGFVIGLLVAAYVFRGVIARTVPGTDVIYSLVGLSTDDPAADLEISIDNHSAVPDDNGSLIFQVKATMFNLSDDPVNVPPLMIIPVDGSGAQMEPILFRLKEQVAEPGQNIKFQKSFDNWPPVATSFVLGIAETP